MGLCYVKEHFMMDITPVLSKYDIPTSSVNRAVVQISDRIRESPNPLKYSNAIIKDFGGEMMLKQAEAEIVAKTLIVEAIQKQTSYDPKIAMATALQKVKEISVKMPWFNINDENVSENKAVRSRSGDKKAAAYKIFKANETKSVKDICTLIQAELNITYANAHYYVSRVFKAK
jgi:hypothetical protein